MRIGRRAGPGPVFARTNPGGRGGTGRRGGCARRVSRRSRSSTNFGRGRGESPYRDLIAWLVDLRSEFVEARSYGFAERIAEIGEDVFVRAARGDVNPCGACGFRESRLDDVLAASALPELQGSLAVVVTDLWLDNSDLIGSARVALQRPIRSILAGGRAIGILGVSAPYSGEVYDVPVPLWHPDDCRRPCSAAPGVRTRHRPAGPGRRAGAAHRRGSLHERPTGGQRHFSLFTPTLAVAGPVEHRLAPQGPSVRRAYVLAVEGTNVPGFLIDRRGVAPLIGDGAEAGPALAAPLSGVGHPGAPAPATFDLAVETWTLVPPEPSAACDDRAWYPLDVGRALRQVADSGGPAIGLDVSHPDLLAIRPGEIAFLRYRVAVETLLQMGPGTAWLDDWSFGADDVPGLLSDPPPLFPALNLAEFGRSLDLIAVSAPSLEGALDSCSRAVVAERGGGASAGISAMSRLVGVLVRAVGFRRWRYCVGSAGGF